MKKLIRPLCMGLIISLGISSCQKDFLNRKPLNAFSDADVWSNLGLVETYVNSKYRALPHFYAGSYAVRSGAESAVSDEGYNQFNYQNVFLWNNGQVSPDNLSLDSWSPYYTFIRDCNVFFQNISDVKGNESLKKRLTGEMKFIRAWCYFDLISRYGGVPLITKVYGLSDPDFLVARNTYDECMSFIIKELNEAADMLPVSYSGAEVGRISKGAALALKSRALMYSASALNNPSNDKTRWQAAADAAKSLIDLADQEVYSLYQEDYRQIFTKEFNSEVILSFNINPTRNNLNQFEYRLNLYIGPNGYHGYAAYVPSQNLVDQFGMKNGKMINEAGSGYDPLHPYQNRDPRFYADILYNGAPFRGREVETFFGGLDSPQGPIENWNSSLTAYYWLKYSDDAQPIDENVGGGQNWIIFRLAEIYLNYAEAAYEIGDEATARQYINLIRSRASVNIPPIVASGDDLLNAIRHERQIELCFEGHRFFDVRRWKIAMETDNQPLKSVKIIKEQDGSFTYLYYTLQDRKFLPQHYLYPIPKYELDRNNLLIQNPNY